MSSGFSSKQAFTVLHLVLNKGNHCQSTSSLSGWHLQACACLRQSTVKLLARLDLQALSVLPLALPKVLYAPPQHACACVIERWAGEYLPYGTLHTCLLVLSCLSFYLPRSTCVRHVGGLASCGVSVSVTRLLYTIRSSCQGVNCIFLHFLVFFSVITSRALIVINS